MLQKGDKKLTHGWAFYDWANSVYSLVISTAVFPIYYETVTQTLSKSTYSKLLPEETKDPTTYFSFFDVTEKLAIGWGTFIFGLAVAITNSMRLSILLLCLFFVASFVVLSFMKKTKYVR